MNETIDWQDLKLFIAVAEAGSLAGAAAITGLSAPTLGRRMYALEQAAGCDLFRRHRNGYDLTPAAGQLLDHAREMQQAATGVERWRDQTGKQSTIKITAGTWTSHFIARHAAELRDDVGETAIALAPGSRFADILRREAHLAVRNRKPTQTGLAAKKLCRVELAVYGAPGQKKNEGHTDLHHLFTDYPWIVFEPAGSSIASSAWIKQNITRAPALSCGTPTPVLDAALAGAGLCVLPCFIGDREAGLTRYSDTIPALSHFQWLVSHDDDRHLPGIRKAANRLQKLFLDNRALFAGEKSTA